MYIYVHIYIEQHVFIYIYIYIYAKYVVSGYNSFQFYFDTQNSVFSSP